VTSIDKQAPESTGCSQSKSSRRFTYHPFEFALAGYSGSGKTTLVCKLLERWSERYNVGFVKHDAHRFEMDREGKDTHRATVAGASTVMINDPRHFARISTLPYSQFERTAAFIDADFVIAEGYKRSDLPKLLVLDTDGHALDEYRAGTFENVRAIAGPSEAPADLDVPYFHRDDVEGIAGFIEEHIHGIADAPLHGLVLLGGESRRMGSPKWALRYGDSEETQAERTIRLLSEVCERVFVSARTEQASELPSHFGLIIDSFPYRGPVAGILSAMHANPHAAWLVAACDLPLLDDVTVRHLVANREPLKIATAYRGSVDKLPEPLCAIWEPRSQQRLLQAAGLRLGCPRKVLIESAPALLDLPNARALDNANTPEEYEEAREALSST
jgi:molybdenum cofactor guanylyltransferase